MRFLYAVSQSHAHMKKGEVEHENSRHLVYEDFNYTVSREEFTVFMKFYNKDMSETLASDIYMYLNGRLKVWLNEKPKKKDDVDDFEDATAMMDTRGRRSNNRDLGGSPSSPMKEVKLEYGLSKWEIESMRINLDAFDREYEKF